MSKGRHIHKGLPPALVAEPVTITATEHQPAGVAACEQCIFGGPTGKEAARAHAWHTGHTVRFVVESVTTWRAAR